MTAVGPERRSFSAVLISQGTHRFYTLALPSEILAQVSFAVDREADPIDGFQRVLQRDRAQQIASYIDQGGVIPNAVILSAQPEANLVYTRTKRSVEFDLVKGAFLILDGQHRVWGYHLAETRLRVQVVIFPRLTRSEEARLFVDINTKQKPVPNELLLDIKKLIDSESTDEQRCGALFDRFNSDPASPLIGLLSPAKRSTGKITRVTFNAAVKPLLPIFEDRDIEMVYDVLRSYMAMAWRAMTERGLERTAITKPSVLRGVLGFFPYVLQRAQDRYGSDYSEQQFSEIASPAFAAVSKKTLQTPRDAAELQRVLESALSSSVRL